MAAAQHRYRHKGERWYDWQCWVLAEPEDADWERYLPFRELRRSRMTGNVAFTPQGCGLEMLVTMACCRWAIEHVFEAARQETGLDTYEVCSTVG